MHLLSLLSVIFFVHEMPPADTTDLLPPKILHAEPLYIDLIRDLGARKGEKEWNLGMGMTDRLTFDSYEFLIEYEWAPINRLGLEVELPVTIFTGFGSEIASNGSGIDPEELITEQRPSNRIESLKMAAQYTFLVSESQQMSLAVGGITELELSDLDKIRESTIFQGVLYNPFFIAAKQWKSNIHTLLYTGPRIMTHFNKSGVEVGYEINSNIHYMIPGTRNFVGIEFNKQLQHGDFDMIIRPQMRLVINEGFMVGIVPGIPISKEKERLSAFLRLIYEPGHHRVHH